MWGFSPAIDLQDVQYINHTGTADSTAQKDQLKIDSQDQMHGAFYKDEPIHFEGDIKAKSVAVKCGSATDADSSLNILICGAGDLRHLLKTLGLFFRRLV